MNVGDRVLLEGASGSGKSTLGAVLAGLRAPLSPRHQTAVLWGGWLLVTDLVFSFMSGIFHAYYTVALAPAIAAVVGIGTGPGRDANLVGGATFGGVVYAGIASWLRTDEELSAAATAHYTDIAPFLREHPIPESDAHVVLLGLNGGMGNTDVAALNPAEPATLAVRGEPAPRRFDALVMCAGTSSAALLRAGQVTKPVVALIAGAFQERYPPGMTFGHAAAMISSGAESASAKRAFSPPENGPIGASAMSPRKLKPPR